MFCGFWWAEVTLVRKTGDAAFLEKGVFGTTRHSMVCKRKLICSSRADSCSFQQKQQNNMRCFARFGTICTILKT